MWILLSTQYYKSFGTVFRPKWFISLTCSSLFYIICRSMMIYYSTQKTSQQMIRVVIVSITLSVLCDFLAVTLRLIFVRSFDFQCRAEEAA